MIAEKDKVRDEEGYWVITEEQFESVLDEGLKNKTFIDFSKCRFTFEIELAEDIETIISFHYSIFEKVVNFIKILSIDNSGSELFRSTTFMEKANFSKCKFMDTTSFKNCIFTKEANFVGSIFEKDISFVNAKFHTSHIYFRYAIFHGVSDFTLADFVRGGSFYRATLYKDIIFKTCNFNGPVDLSWLNTNPNKKNNEIINTGLIRFKESIIAGTLNFTNSFLESLEFEDNDFQKHIILPDENNLKKITRSFYRLAKHQKMAQHDQVGALEYYAKEMHKHAEEVKVKHKNFFPYLFKFVLFNCLYFRICWTIRRKIFKKQHSLKLYREYKNKAENNMRKFKTRLSNFGDYMIMLLSSLTDYGLNWAKGLGIFVGVVLAVSIIGATVSVFKYPDIGFGVKFFGTLFKLINPASLLNPTNFIQGIHFMADPECGLYTNSLSIESCKNLTTQIRWQNFWELLWVIGKDTFIFIWSIFYAVMGYQVYRAFRKYSRSLE